MSVRTNLTLTDEMHQALTQLSRERRQAVAYLVREAIAQYLERSRVRIQNIHPSWGGPRPDESTGEK